MARWRRRPLPPAEPIPEELARFVAVEWPGPRPWAAWAAACVTWLEADPSRRLPFGEYGDRLDVAREARRARRASFGWDS